jgi:acyl carrier protein
MTHQEIRQIVVDIIEVVAPDADLSNLKDDVRLRDQLELDSMDFLDIVMELRKRYKIEVPKDDYQKLASLDSCVEYLGPKFESIGATSS